MFTVQQSLTQSTRHNSTKRFFGTAIMNANFGHCVMCLFQLMVYIYVDLKRFSHKIAVNKGLLIIYTKQTPPVV